DDSIREARSRRGDDARGSGGDRRSRSTAGTQGHRENEAATEGGPDVPIREIDEKGPRGAPPPHANPPPGRAGAGGPGRRRWSYRARGRGGSEIGRAARRERE